MTRFFINYYTQDNGWIEFKTKEERDNALKELESGESELDDMNNSYHWFNKAIIDQRGKDLEERFVSEEVG